MMNSLLHLLNLQQTEGTFLVDILPPEVHPNSLLSRINVDFKNRVAGKTIDLHRLYNIVTSRGGYDAVSGEKLAWRKIGGDFNLGSANAAAYAFALKTTYYKNLA